MRVKRQERKRIDKEVEIVIRNNTHGAFEVPGIDSTISLEKQGDEEFVTFGELRKLKKYIEELDIVIVEVNSNDYSLYDIITALRLNKVYDEYFKYVLNEPDTNAYPEIDYIDPESFDEFIIDCDNETFKEALDTKLRKQIILTSVVLYKKHELTDYTKMTLIKQTRPEKEQSEFWNDIDASVND